MKRAPVSDDLMSAVYDLATVRPHQADDARYDAREWRAYCDGYYYALRMSLRAMELALVRRKLRERELRRAALEQKTA